MIKNIRKISEIIGLVVIVLTLFFTIKEIKKEFFPSQQSELKYKISCLPILDKEQLQTFPKQDYKYILQSQYKNDSPENIDMMTYYRVEIINVGKKIIKFNDIHKNNPLKILLDNSFLIGAYVDNNTPNYIGANIDTKTENEIIIKFDCINLKDKISIIILLNENSEWRGLAVVGSSDYFSPNIKPFDIGTAKEFGTDEEYKEELQRNKKKLIIYKVTLFISVLSLSLILLLSYRKYLGKRKKYQDK